MSEDTVVEHIVSAIRETDAGQFEEIVQELAIMARETGQEDRMDPAWVDAACLLKHAAVAIRERRGN